MNNTFEDRLWNALKHEAERPRHDLPADHFRAGPARRAVTARRAALGLTAAAAVGMILAIVPGGGASPAYAVEMQKGGVVKVTIHEASKATQDRAQVEALESKLRAAGINVIVDASTPYLCHFNGGHQTQFMKMPRRPGPNITDVAFAGSGVVNGGGTVLLHQGDTAWIEGGPSAQGGRLYAVELMGATCAPADGGR